MAADDQRDAGVMASRAGAAGNAAAQNHEQNSATSGVPVDTHVDDDAGTGDKPTSSEPVLSPTKLPSIEGQCPDLNGNGTHMFSAGGRSLMVDIHMRADAKRMPAPGGPLIMYFHSVGDEPAQVTESLGQSAIDAVVAQGGVVASFQATPCLRCGLADDVVWYDEDDVVSDQVVACAIQKAQIDTRRINAVGFSSGALHSMHLVLARSNYLASVVVYSGGTPTAVKEAQDPTNKVPALMTFGREGVDNAVLDFNLASLDWYNTYVPRGYYVLLCNHGRGHEIPTDMTAHALRFLLDHPYRVSPEPYSSKIPSEFPSYCTNSP